MARIANLRMTCPECGKYTNIYVTEDGGSSAKVKCEHCRGVFVFGAGAMYEPVGYVSSMPGWAVIRKGEEPRAVPVVCKQCGKHYDAADAEMESGLGQKDYGILDPSNPAFRKLLGLKSLLKCSNCGAIACSDCAQESGGIIGMRCPFCQVDYTAYSYLRATGENVSAGSPAPQTAASSPAKSEPAPKAGFFQRLFGKKK